MTWLKNQHLWYERPELLALAAIALWSPLAATLTLGLYGLFDCHFLLFLAFRHAPPVEANLVNYLWPLGIVFMAPLFLPGVYLHAVRVVSAVVGFAGAALAILDKPGIAPGLNQKFEWGYVLALAAAFTWSSHSLLTRRVALLPTSAIGMFAALPGLFGNQPHP